MCPVLFFKKFPHNLEPAHGSSPCSDVNINFVFIVYYHSVSSSSVPSSAPLCPSPSRPPLSDGNTSLHVCCRRSLIYGGEFHHKTKK
mmetsp:Transcript_14059/g.22963  ORF Transcript_14059/g.22963 Transcript_14059/m.22963 type:complete len:87 (+) Transcript_14059:2124-2384(+)